MLSFHWDIGDRAMRALTTSVSTDNCTYAVFQPKRTDDIRDGFSDLIGKKLKFQLNDRSGDDEPYPGQNRWYIVPDQPGIQNSIHGWMWVPECDLVFDTD